MDGDQQVSKLMDTLANNAYFLPIVYVKNKAFSKTMILNFMRTC